MWPMLLDMSKRECKIELRKLELEAYSVVVSTFRAQGNLNQAKIQLLKELESVLKVSSDRSKAEMRRACNDEKLYTIAKKLSRGECVTSEWLIQSKRFIPLLPRLQQTTTSSYYRILADHILQNSKPILKLYSNPCDTKSTSEPLTIKKEPNEVAQKEDKADEIKTAERKKTSQRLIKKKVKQEENENNKNEENSLAEKENGTLVDSKTDVPQTEENNIFYLANGYAISSNFVQVIANKPSEFVQEYESAETEDGSFLKSLILKHKKQKEEKQNLEQLLQVQQQQPQLTVSKETEIKKEHEATNTTNNTKTNTKNSKLISQMIEANNSLNKKIELDKQQIKQVQSVAVPNVNKMPAQIIRLETSSSSIYNQPMSTSASQMPNTSTIVKLTPQTSILNGTSNLVTTSSSFGQLLNLNNQNLKHFVLPKTNQKLIILPSSSNNANPSISTSNLNTTTLKKNFIISSTNNTTPNNSSSIKIISHENSEKNNGNLRIIQNGHTQTASPLPKVILYKPTQQSSIIKLTNDTNLPNEKIETNGDSIELKQFKDDQDENKQDLEENQLKRKHSIDVDKTTKHKIIKIEDTVPDWHEDNLQLVNNILNNN